MFFFLPVKIGKGSDNQILPVANFVLIAINILFFFFPAMANGSSFFYNTIKWAFIHGGFWHLFFNMWVLWVFGSKVNRRLGNFWYSIVYLASIVFMGVLLRMILKVNIIGASGAVFTVIAICLILMPAVKIDIFAVAVFPLSLAISLFIPPKHWIYWFVRWGSFQVKALWGLFIIPLMQFAGLFWGGWNWTNFGHLLGLAVGVAAVLVLPKYICYPQRGSIVTGINYEFEV